MENFQFPRSRVFEKMTKIGNFHRPGFSKNPKFIKTENSTFDESRIFTRSKIEEKIRVSIFCSPLTNKSIGFCSNIEQNSNVNFTKL